MISKRGLCLIAAMLCLLSTEAHGADATVQDMQIVGRALSFKEGHRRGTIEIAIVYDGSDGRSVSEMRAAVAALGAGLRVGDSELRPVAVEQSAFKSASDYGGVFATGSVNQGLLRSALGSSGVPCFTLDVGQVSSGACTVAIRSRPSVSISISSRNAAAADVRFATAFIMMVREI
ncbi:hypothetical protein [Aureimonas jatrophae]|uniref:Uncharacterized protein n=1 Tax=Aureimonas jatrophae TaxID=1166073 RepID=A0A1H0MY46_9HYPH|nr:hypothetical protein [Aureimonas jatrophae]MBB3953001.1 hypothetical protein [Aureimonas jatrophae]SDO85334.1 hypothetical protein SAMN05192530_1167 [Aureimonas jatrophae]